MLLVLVSIWRRCAGTPASRNPDGQPPNGQPPNGQPPNGQPPNGQPSPSPYQCRHCFTTILLYQIVQSENPNRNGGRSYYICVNRRCPNVTGPNNVNQHYRGWVTWDDTFGVESWNPPCKCRRSARLDTAGERSVRHGQQFWTCSTGACDFFSWL